MKIERTLNTEKATFEITMMYDYREIDADGHVFKTDEVIKLTTVRLWIDGEFIQSSTEGFIYLTDGKTRFGDIYITEATGIKLLKEIEEMHNELSTAFGIKTPAQEAQEAREDLEKLKLKRAERIMEEVKIRKTEILSNVDEKIWRTNYNNICNEGGEGYVPTRVTIEDVEWAKELLGK